MVVHVLILSYWVDSQELEKTGELTIHLFVNPLKAFRWPLGWWRCRVWIEGGGIAGLPVSFTKCDISREQTAGLMCDISPRGESQVQIASRLDINGDSSSWPFPHSAIIPSCPLTKGSTEEAAVQWAVQWAAAGAAARYHFNLRRRASFGRLCPQTGSVAPFTIKSFRHAAFLFCVHQQDKAAHHGSEGS